MNRRLLLLLALVLAAAVIQLSLYGIARFRSSRPPDRAGPPARRTPPEDPPPGRPTAKQAVRFSAARRDREALQAAVKGTNLVICVLDAARADHVGCYGYPRDTTSNLDRLAKQSLVFDQHFAQIPQTCPSTLSLLTSLYPDSHGVLNNLRDRASFETIGPETFTMEQGLQRAGFRTFLLSSNPAASPALGVGADFMHQDYRSEGRPGQEENGTEYLLRLLSELPARLKGSESPFFAYLHVLPPHTPYQAPPEMQQRFRGSIPPRHWESTPGFVEPVNELPDVGAPASWVEWINAYDANLRWADAVVGALEQTLTQAGLLENTLLIITSDHGEAFREHGYIFHIDCPYDEALHIPLLIRFPGPNKPVGRIGALTQTIDLLPTIFDLYQFRYPREEVQGTSLLPLLAGEAGRSHEFVFSRAGVSKSTFAIVRDADFVLMLFGDGRGRALYEMNADPWQSRNAISSHREQAAALAQTFAKFAARQHYPPLQFLDPKYKPRPGTRPSAQMSEETRRRLKSLGYLR